MSLASVSVAEFDWQGSPALVARRLRTIGLYSDIFNVRNVPEFMPPLREYDIACAQTYTLGNRHALSSTARVTGFRSLKPITGRTSRCTSSAHPTPS